MSLAQQPQNEKTDPLCLDPEIAAALLMGAPWRRFGVIGDSLSAGIGDTVPGYAPGGWAERAAGVLRRVQPDLAYLNLAQLGKTTEQALAEQMDRMLEFGPDLLVLNSGGNDIWRRTTDFDAIEATLRRMYVAAARTDAVTAVMTLSRNFVVDTFPDFPDRVRRINDVTRRLATEFDVVVIEMWDHPVNERPNLLSADGIHFSAAGQAVLATEFLRQLSHLLHW